REKQKLLFVLLNDAEQRPSDGVCRPAAIGPGPGTHNLCTRPQRSARVVDGRAVGERLTRTGALGPVRLCGSGTSMQEARLQARLEAHQRVSRMVLASWWPRRSRRGARPEEPPTTHSELCEWVRIVDGAGLSYLLLMIMMNTVLSVWGMMICLNGVSRITISLAESFKWSCGATYFFSMWLLILTLLMFMETQYALLSVRLRTAKGLREVAECVERMSEMMQFENDMRAIFFTGVLHMLAGALLVPLINTYQLLFGPRTMFSALTLSTLPLVYGSMSLLGDRLALGCDEVRFAAYSGDWPDEEPRVRRLRVMLMQSCSRGAPFAVRGLGDFTRGAAYHVLKTWYQYLNLLISTVA
ncbi:Odorant receptor 45, partial [Frankliniella occidentalis]